jgi:hypothetical protein
MGEKLKKIGAAIAIGMAVRGGNSTAKIHDAMEQKRRREERSAAQTSSRTENRAGRKKGQS